MRIFPVKEQTMTNDADQKRRPGDYLMAFEDSCDRAPVLLIHGFPLSSALWDFQVDDLSDIARLIAPDLRGHGLSDPTQPPLGIGDYAADCARLLDHLGIEGPVVIAGLSMGGYVAFEICRSFPERVAGLILASTRAGADSAEGRANRDKAAGKAIAGGAEAIAADMLPKLLAPAAYEENPDLVEFVSEMILQTSTDGLVGALTAMRDRPDSTPDLPGLDIPTLILHGEEDQLIPVAEAEVMRKGIPGAELVIVPEAGHLPNLEQPDIFNDAVREFLDGFY